MTIPILPDRERVSEEYVDERSGYPNHLSLESFVAEVQSRVADGLSAARAFVEVSDGVRNWVELEEPASVPPGSSPLGSVAA